MKRSLWLANLGFVPVSMDLAVLFLRLTLGISMITLHGWGKLIQFPAVVENFPDPLGLGRPLSLALAIFTELFCSVLLMAGIVTRFAAALLLVTMAVALFRVHGGNFSAPGAETATLYLFGFGTIVISGGGRLSADSAGGPWSLAALAAGAGALIGYPFSYLFQGGAYRGTVPFQEYLSGFREVVQSDATRTTAVLVWVLTVLIFAVAGFLVGRAMNRRRVRIIHTVESPEEPPVL